MDNSKYYEFFNWEIPGGSGHDDLMDAISPMIPDDVKKILDVGCGNGILTNELARRYDITGVDRSEKALSFLQCNKIKASCEDIPVPDRSYDLVMSTELLEHLEPEVLKRTVSEFGRISDKYILITVPHEENIEKMLIKCPECGYVYNRIYHLGKFSRKSLEELFPGYKTINYKITGKPVRVYNLTLSRLKRKYTPSASWIPWFWVRKDRRKSLCPNCEHTFEYLYRFNFLAMAIDLANVAISPKRPYWQAILLART